MVKTGEPAPSFNLPSTSGGERALEEFRGKKLVIFFYPKDETPGCTREACGFRDNYSAIRDLGAEVIGISKDSIASHDRFRDNQSLPFELLSDSDNSLATQFGAFGEKKMYGRTVMGTIRSTFLLDEHGVIEHVWSPVRVDGHVEKVVEHLGGTPAAPGSTAKTPKAAKSRLTKKKVAKKSARKKATKKKVTEKKATKKKVTKKKATKKKVTKKKVTKKKATKKKATKKKVTKKKAAKKKATKKSKRR